jgi:hypothetical protein
MGPERVGHSNRQMCFCKKGFRPGDCDLRCERKAAENAAEYAAYYEILGGLTRGYVKKSTESAIGGGLGSAFW